MEADWISLREFRGMEADGWVFIVSGLVFVIASSRVARPGVGSSSTAGNLALVLEYSVQSRYITAGQGANGSVIKMHSTRTRKRL